MKFSALILAMTLFAVFVSAQRSGCVLVPIADASAVVGAGAEKHEYGGNCVYQVKGKTLRLSVNSSTDPHAKDLFNATKTMLKNAGGTITDQPGIGDAAFLANVKGAKTVYIVKGNSTLEISVADGAKGYVAESMAAKLIDTARNAARRM